jgi:Cro/C1-type HTH DNA-binding domain
MKVRNRIKEFCDDQGLTAYALWKATKLSEPTVYRLYKDPELIPSGKVLEGLAEAFPDTTPNDWLKFEKDDESIASASESEHPQRRRSQSAAKAPKPKQEFRSGQMVKNPAGWRGWITKLLDDGKAVVDWEGQVNGDVIPARMLRACE